MTGQQPALFQADKLVPTACPVGYCQALRLPGQTKVPTCAHDLDPESRRRPSGCLNEYRPEHAEIPF